MITVVPIVTAIIAVIQALAGGGVGSGDRNRYRSRGSHRLLDDAGLCPDRA